MKEEVTSYIKYSFLVPVFNVEKYISKCLESLLNQTYQNYEIIISDDRSNDRSAEICEQYKKKYSEKIRVYHNSENVGLYQNRFHLFHEAKGEYLICVDSDDYVSTNLLDEIERTVNTYNCDLVIYDYYAEYQFRFGLVKHHKICYSDSNRIFDDNNKKELYMDLTTGNLNSIWRKAFKRELICDSDFIKGFDKMSIGEDLLLSLSIINIAKKIVYINMPLYYYRRNLKSLTRSSSLEKRIKCMQKVLKTLSDFVERWELPNERYFYEYYNRTVEEFMKQISYGYKRYGIEKSSEMFDLLADDESYRKVLDKIENIPYHLELLKNKNYISIYKIYSFWRIKQKIKYLLELLIIPPN